MLPVARNAAHTTAILRTSCESDLARIAEHGMQAIIYTPARIPEWMAALAAAVESGAFQVRRSVVSDLNRTGLSEWLDVELPNTGVDQQVRSALQQDVLALWDRVSSLTSASRVQLRIFTGAPSENCGFHVDTVPPGAPPLGVVRVYNGEGTRYVDPAQVVSMRDFYRYLSRRERLQRDLSSAGADGNEHVCRRLEQQIADLDREPSFLKPGGSVYVVPTGSIVVFRHVDVRYHWSDHPQSAGWIHCSPMSGCTRLVVNLLPTDASGRRRAAGGGALRCPDQLS